MSKSFTFHILIGIMLGIHHTLGGNNSFGLKTNMISLFSETRGSSQPCLRRSSLLRSENCTSCHRNHHQPSPRQKASWFLHKRRHRFLKMKFRQGGEIKTRFEACTSAIKDLKLVLLNRMVVMCLSLNKLISLSSALLEVSFNFPF